MIPVQEGERGTLETRHCRVDVIVTRITDHPYQRISLPSVTIECRSDGPSGKPPTLERQMARAVLDDDDEAAAMALADRLIEKRRAGSDVMGEMMTALQMVLLFHKGGIWGEEEMRAWEESTGHKVAATTRGLCDVVRAVLAKAEGRKA